MKRKTLGEMLVAANLIDEVQMKIALAEQQSSGRRFGSTLVELQFIDENVLTAFLSKQLDVPCISLLHVDIPRKILRRIPREVALDCSAIPVRYSDGELEVAMVDPTDIDLIDRIEKAVGMPVVPMVAPQTSIEKMIERVYRDGDDDTLAGRRRSRESAPHDTPADPIFLDLIEELERGDFEARLDRMEEGLNQIWTLLEKVLRQLETSAVDRSQRQ